MSLGTHSTGLLENCEVNLTLTFGVFKLILKMMEMP